MKRVIFLFLTVAIVSGGTLFAQNRNQGYRQWTAPEKTSISGTLGISRGHISVQNDGKTYFLMGLNRFIGFIDGLKEGASVQLEGYGMQSGNRNTANEIYFRITKLTMNGKSYDLDNDLFDFRGMGVMPMFGRNTPGRNNRMTPPSAPFQRQQPRNNSRRR